MSENERRLNALIINCYVCAFGAFGAFFRWLQNQIAYDKETGVTDPSIWNVMVPLAIIAAAVALYQISKKKFADMSYPRDMYSAFCGVTEKHYAMAWMVGGLCALGGIIAFFSASAEAQSGGMRFIGLLAVLTGVSFPAICSASKRHLAPGMVSVFSALPIALFTMWLVVCYVKNANVPNVWTYGIEVITISIVIIAFYYLAGYAFGKPQPEKALYTSMLSAFMCIVSVADSRTLGEQLVIMATAAMFVMYSWMIVGNMKKREETEAAPEEIQEEPEEEPQEPVLEDVPVIPAGEKIERPEPTLQAPEHRSDDEIDSIIDEFK